MDVSRPELVAVAAHDLRVAWSIEGDSLRFARALAELQTFTAGELLDFLEKPHKWAPEFVEWVIAGEPSAGSVAAWGAWAEAVEALT